MVKEPKLLNTACPRVHLKELVWNSRHLASLFRVYKKIVKEPKLHIRRNTHIYIYIYIYIICVYTILVLSKTHVLRPSKADVSAIDDAHIQTMAPTRKDPHIHKYKLKIRISSI